MISADRLRQLLDYDPDTGIFRWRDDRSGGVLVGSRAGGVHDGRRYRRVTLDGRRYREHQLAWLYVYGQWPHPMLDHINGDRGDNRISNLREVTPTQNAYNSRPRGTGLKGTKRAGRRFTATILRAGRNKHLGTFDTEEDAHAAYRQAATELHGEFARFE